MQGKVILRAGTPNDENRSYLPGFSLPDHLVATNDLLEASMEKDMVVLLIRADGKNRRLLISASPSMTSCAEAMSATAMNRRATRYLISVQWLSYIPRLSCLRSLP